MEDHGNKVIKLHATLSQTISKFTSKTNQEYEPCGGAMGALGEFGTLRPPFSGPSPPLVPCPRHVPRCVSQESPKKVLWTVVVEGRPRGALLAAPGRYTLERRPRGSMVAHPPLIP